MNNIGSIDGSVVNMAKNPEIDVLKMEMKMKMKMKKKKNIRKKMTIKIENLMGYAAIAGERGI